MSYQCPGSSTSDSTSLSYFDTFVSVAQTYDVKKIYIVDSEFVIGGDREEDADFNAKLTGIEENFKAADGTTINLDSATNLWLFNGKVLEKSANDYSVDDVINWNLVLTQMFAYGKTGE